MSKQVEEEEFESFIDEEPISPLSINKYDPFSVKAAIDECLVNLLEERQFTEDNYWMDLKIVTAAILLVITAVAQLYKPDPSWEFLNNKPFQCVLIVLYGFFTCVYWYIDNYCIDEIFFITKTHPVSTFALTDT